MDRPEILDPSVPLVKSGRLSAMLASFVWHGASSPVVEEEEEEAPGPKTVNQSVAKSVLRSKKANRWSPPRLILDMDLT